jgi:hypothetical protein
MKIKTSELTGDNLGYAVALIEYPEWKEQGYLESVHDLYFDDGEHYAPWENWAQGGPIIDREDIAISPAPDGLCSAYKSDGTTRWLTKGGPTPTSGVEVFNWTYKQQGYHPLIAAMRCYVASKLGDEIDLPEELT